MSNNLRALSIDAISNIKIKVLFTDPLNPNIDIENISFLSQTPGVPDPQALSVRILDKTLEITTQPLTSLAAYFIVFNSTDAIPFTSLNNTATLFEDGVGNRLFFLGPLEPTNPVKEYFLNYLRESVYNTESGTVLNDYLNVLSTLMVKAFYDIRQARNENYLSVTITDERKERAPTPFDHLDEEGVYEIIRVGKTETGSLASMTIAIDEFGVDPISLLQANSTESLVVNSINNPGTFNINEFILNFSKRFVIKLTSVIFTYTGGHLPYEYDIAKYGYQILDQKYDNAFAFKFLQLADNQIKLSDKILEDPEFSTDSIFQIQVVFQYKDTGRVIDISTLAMESVTSSGREVLPPLFNVFNLQHAPIVTVNNKIGTLGDIKFVDQNSLAVLQTPHPAFVEELKFRLDFLPSSIGEYAVDYETGTVYVFGETQNDGTGAVPPLAIYKYRLNFKEDIDWVIDASSNDLVALPTGGLRGSSANISFNFEQVLARGIDYQPQIHQEVLDERVGNKLVALNALTVDNTPITNVFRVFNETTGEIYNVSRWNDNKIFFTYLNPPNLQEHFAERASFETINNEVMFVSTVLDVINPLLKIFKIVLNNNNIIAQSEDCVGASFNSTVSLSNQDIFVNELYFNVLQDEATNLIRLSEAGLYFIDYHNGVVYVTVANSQDFNIGSISYKRSYIDLINPHITSVEDIYYRINTLMSKGKHFEYTSFEDGLVLPASFDMADEHLLSGDANSPYIVSSEKVGAFVGATFVHAVSENIQFIRSIYESEDLLNNIAPINFSESASFVNRSITIAPIIRNEYHTVEFDGADYFIFLNTGLQYLSSNIALDITVTRLSDSQSLWDGTGTIVLGNLIKLILPGVGSPQVGDGVQVSYSYTIDNLSHVIVDYNKGEYYIDYTALMDEIIVSYEYGGNALDFRQSNTLDIGETYFVSYKVGALRDALLKNFGSLIDIDILNTFDITFSRERYRDAIMAAMHSFSTGPTVAALEQIASTISHLPVKVKESVFETWSLGHSILSPHPYETGGSLLTSPVKYNDGLLINQTDQEVRLPVISNLKLGEGTFESWIRPQWDGLDNLAELEITPLKDGYLMSELDIFIGALEYHPEFISDPSKKLPFFGLDKNKKVDGTPNKNKDGLYIYYDKDYSGDFYRWYVDVVDGYADGYTNKLYTITINTPDGKFYDLKSTLNPQPSTTKTTSGTDNIVFKVNSTFPNEGITFLADIPHYILDFGEEANKNRFSIFKDESGYLNFKVFDRFNTSYVVSANVSSWRHSELHHIATAWKLDNKMGRDELHLFIDGFEVPNIIRYGDRIKPYLHEKYRTVNPEEVVGEITRNIISSTDLSTVAGSAQVISSLNFGQYGINIGDTFYIEEVGFDTAGYSIINVNGNTLTLNIAMPVTITDGTFSVNKTSLDVATEIDIFPNFAVSLIHSFFLGSDLDTTMGSDVVVDLSVDFEDEGLVPGDLIRINHPDFEKHYIILEVTSNALTVNDDMPSSLSGLTYNIYHNEEEEIPGLRALHPAYELSKSTDGYFTNILTVRDKALIDDLVLIRTLGINHRRVRRKYYVWGNQSNILKTKLPTPISLDEVKVYKVLLPGTFIGPGNSTLLSGIFTSNNILVDLTSNGVGGRTLSISIRGDNIDFSTSTTVEINGIVAHPDTIPTLETETLTFNEPGSQDTTKLFAQVNYIVVTCKPFNTSINAAIVEVKEKYPVTKPENVENFISSNDIIPQAIVRYSYQVGVGNTLFSDGYQGGDGYTVADDNAFFSSSTVSNYLIIHQPTSVAGFYKIASVADDHKSLTVSIEDSIGELPFTAFTDGYYEILNITDYRSGLQNGYFTFEYLDLPGEPFFLTGGWYELDYYTYLTAPFDLKSMDMYIGSDFEGKNHLHGYIDEMQVLNVKLTDTRIGETAAKTQRTITKEFNSLKASIADVTTLVLTHFDGLPLSNDADIYTFADTNIIQAGEVINDNFSQSICLIDSPLKIDNNGVLDTKKEGTIEFWVNPLYDALNDPNYRFYFDAFGAVSENLISTNNLTINLKGTTAEVLHVKLASGSQDTDYFAGGDITNNGKTLILHRALPHQNTNIIVSYIPKGLKGDRISIYKDPFGYVNFNVRADNIDYQVRVPTFWARNTWHRVKASYKVNSGSLKDEIHLFIDGYERGNVLFGNGLLFGQGMVYGSSFAGPNIATHNIKFADPINQLYVGSDFNRGNSAHCLMDNLRISNQARPLYQPFGEPLDPNYSSNLAMVYPITEDLYTTLLLNFNSLVTLQEDFAALYGIGLSDFSIDILNTLDIISTEKTKDILEAILNSFKPATSKMFVNYLK